MKYLKLFEEQLNLNDVDGFERITPLVESSLFSVYEIKSFEDLKKYTSDEHYYNILKTLKNSGSIRGTVNIENVNNLFKYKNYIIVPKFNSSKVGNIFVNFDAMLYEGEFFDDVDIYNLLKIPQNKILFEYFNNLWKDDIIRVYHNDFDEDCLYDSMGVYGVHSYGDGYKYIQDSKENTYIVFEELSDLSVFFDSPDLYKEIIDFGVEAYYSDIEYDHYYVDYTLDKNKNEDIYNKISDLIEEFINDNDLEEDEIEELREIISSPQIDMNDLYKLADNYIINDIKDPIDLAINRAACDARSDSYSRDVVQKLLDHFGGGEFITDMNSLFPNLNSEGSRYKYTMGIKITDEDYNPYSIIQNRKDNLYSSSFNCDNILDILDIDSNGYCDEYIGSDELDYESNDVLIELDYEYSEPDYDIKEDDFFEQLIEEL